MNRVGQGALRLVSNHSLLFFLIVLIALFSVLKTNTFPTQLTLQGILSSKTVIVMLALGLMFPLATNCFDLSIGYVVALTNSAVSLALRGSAPVAAPKRIRATSLLPESLSASKA